MVVGMVVGMVVTHRSDGVKVETSVERQSGVQQRCARRQQRTQRGVVGRDGVG
jgi:hypothetical protein